MKLKETKAYRTSDGSLFGDLPEAGAHQARLDLRVEIENQFVGRRDQITTDELVVWLLARARPLDLILTEYLSTQPLPAENSLAEMR